jgi:hypothetical protein
LVSPDHHQRGGGGVLPVVRLPHVARGVAQGRHRGVAVQVKVNRKTLKPDFHFIGREGLKPGDFKLWVNRIQLVPPPTVEAKTLNAGITSGRQRLTPAAFAFKMVVTPDSGSTSSLSGAGGAGAPAIVARADFAAPRATAKAAGAAAPGTGPAPAPAPAAATAAVAAATAAAAPASGPTAATAAVAAATAAANSAPAAGPSPFTPTKICPPGTAPTKTSGPFSQSASPPSTPAPASPPETALASSSSIAPLMSSMHP